MNYTEAEIEAMLEAAGQKAAQKATDAHAAHEAFHGRPVRMIVVGARRGYRGQVVCHDCYYEKVWTVRT